MGNRRWLPCSYQKSAWIRKKTRRFCWYVHFAIWIGAWCPGKPWITFGRDLFHKGIWKETYQNLQSFTRCICSTRSPIGQLSRSGAFLRFKSENFWKIFLGKFLTNIRSLNDSSIPGRSNWNRPQLYDWNVRIRRSNGSWCKYFFNHSPINRHTELDFWEHFSMPTEN